MSERERAWDELYAAVPAGWWVGTSSYHDERREWVLMRLTPQSVPSWRAQAGVAGRRAD